MRWARCAERPYKRDYAALHSSLCLFDSSCVARMAHLAFHKEATKKGLPVFELDHSAKRFRQCLGCPASYLSILLKLAK